MYPSKTFCYGKETSIKNWSWNFNLKTIPFSDWANIYLMFHYSRRNVKRDDFFYAYKMNIIRSLNTESSLLTQTWLLLAEVRVKFRSSLLLGIGIWFRWNALPFFKRTSFCEKVSFEMWKLFKGTCSCFVPHISRSGSEWKASKVVSGCLLSPWNYLAEVQFVNVIGRYAK